MHAHTQTHSPLGLVDVFLLFDLLHPNSHAILGQDNIFLLHLPRRLLSDFIGDAVDYKADDRNDDQDDEEDYEWQEPGEGRHCCCWLPIVTAVAVAQGCCVEVR